jgi:plastocyanin
MTCRRSGLPFLGALAAFALSACSSDRATATRGTTDGGNTASGGASAAGGQTGSSGGTSSQGGTGTGAHAGTSSDGGAGPRTPPDGGSGVNACLGAVNTPGSVVDMAWPNPSNVGHEAKPGDTVRFHWSSGSHNVLEGALFEGNDPAIGAFADPAWPGEIRSGGKTPSQSFDWDTGAFPCGYRPGEYYFLDENDPTSGIVALDLTDTNGAHYAPKACSKLSDPLVYNGRYAKFSARPNCMEYEVNNFQTGSHYDWVQPTFGVTQGDLVLFRWSGLHNVVQVHDVNQDALVAGGILSGPRTNCVPGPYYSCVNGDPNLGEYLIDTEDYRPGMIHITDGCAYGCNASCPWQCNGADHNPTGTNMEFLLSRAEKPTIGGTGSCCAIDKAKGQACRVIDLYNDNTGMQFDYNVGFNRGDLVRMRWGGSIKILQTTAASNGSPTRTPRSGGIAMASAVECIPGPHWTCLGGNAPQAELILDVDAAIGAGQMDADGQFRFFAFGENTDGFSSQDSGILLWQDKPDPYGNNPPCP